MEVIAVFGLLALILFIKRKKLIKRFQELTQTGIEYQKLAKCILEIFLESAISINATILCDFAGKTKPAGKTQRPEANKNIDSPIPQPIWVCAGCDHIPVSTDSIIEWDKNSGADI